ncbi:MAG: NAD/NADP octopine/nopaline dehydrogenase family protein [Bacteroides sp.]|nr:NAD/NADP octopine/nopaline dehydrogenase family protein [Bacteroides sp.]MCM1447590.1 NAD/NADP octopine/nopaline dehydrogenase family protein [Bacteroides sp.]
MKVCVCGGGNLGHVVAAFLALQPSVEVTILTRSPQRWSHDLTLRMPDCSERACHVSHITSDAARAIPDADCVIMCLPGFAFADEMRLIAPHISPGTVVGSVVSNTGFFFEAQRHLPACAILFGLQRVPFISRTLDYGSKAHLMGTKPMLYACVTGNGKNTPSLSRQEDVRAMLQQLFATPVSLLGSIYEASLSNSNPLLHPARMYAMWHDWDGVHQYDSNCLFYEEWTDEASELLIGMDGEFFRLLDVLPVRKGSITPILEYYESTDAPSLTLKLRSIRAFHGIMSPMRRVEGGYVPDLSSRYFTEDFLLGLAMIHRLVEVHHVSAPIIHKVYAWGMGLLGKG